MATLNLYLDRCSQAYHDYQSRARTRYVPIFYSVVVFGSALGMLLLWFPLKWIGVRLGVWETSSLTTSPNEVWFMGALFLLLFPSMAIGFYSAAFAFGRVLRFLKVLSAQEASEFALYGQFPERWLHPLPPNQPLHPTPSAAEAPASGAGERRR